MGGWRRMSWDGIERRRESKETFCPAHIEFVADMSVIKTTLINIEKTLTEGTTFKSAVVMAFIGITLTLVIQVIVFSYFIGQMNRQVEVNTARLAILEDMNRTK